MTKRLLNYENYVQFFQEKDIRSIRPYSEVCPKLLGELTKKHKTDKRDFLAKPFRELKKRLPDEDYKRVHYALSNSFILSQRVFPGYKVLIPDIIASDWVASVGWSKFHRDHLLHQPMTAYVVNELLELLPFLPQKAAENILCGDEMDYFRDFCRQYSSGAMDFMLEDNQVNRYRWEDLFKEAAFLAAMFNDMGYPWQYINRIASTLQRIDAKSVAPTPDARTLIAEYGERLLFAPMRGYQTIGAPHAARWVNEIEETTKSLLTGTHGFPGSIGFLYLNDCLQPKKRMLRDGFRFRQLCVEWAALAILMHDAEKVYREKSYLRLSMKKDPLSFVLTLADSIQDFARCSATFPHAEEREAEDKEIKMKYKEPCEDVEIDWDATRKELQVTYRMNGHARTVQKRGFINGEAHSLFDPGNGYLDLSGSGLSRVKLNAVEKKPPL